MFFKHKDRTKEYDRDNYTPVIRASICSGEQVAGFKNIHTGEFIEEMYIAGEKDLLSFKKMYGLSDIKKEY